MYMYEEVNMDEEELQTPMSDDEETDDTDETSDDEDVAGGDMDTEEEL